MTIAAYVLVGPVGSIDRRILLLKVNELSREAVEKAISREIAIRTELIAWTEKPREWVHITK